MICSYFKHYFVLFNVNEHHTKHFGLKKTTKCFDKSILFIFRRFGCHQTHYQGTAFRLKFSIFTDITIFIKP